MYGVIYTITNKINFKTYCGLTVNYPKRKTRHLYALRHNQHWNAALQNSFNKHGEENFIFDIVEIHNTQEELGTAEMKYIAQHDLLNKGKGYNMTIGGEGGGDKFITFSEEEKKSIYERRRPKISGVNNPNYGKPMTEEIKSKISASRKGKGAGANNGNYSGLSDEHKEKLSLSHKGKVSPRKGSTLSMELKEKLSTARKNSTKINRRRIICINTGQVFNSISEAAAFVNIDRAGINRCCQGIREMAGGFKWSYTDQHR